MFSLRNQAQTYLDLVDHTLGWIGDSGPRASIQDWHDRLSFCRQSTNIADEIYQEQWQRLLDGADRQYQINPRRLLHVFRREGDNTGMPNEDPVAQRPE
jgi:hypothetical protein